MTRRALAYLPLVVLAAGGAVEAADTRIVIAASADAFCPPCRTVVMLGLPPGSSGTLTMQLLPAAGGGTPPAPWTQPLTASGSGVADGWFPVSQPGMYVVGMDWPGISAVPAAHTVVDCAPPWQPPSPIDCPPPSPWRGPLGAELTSVLLGHRGQRLTAIFERLRPGKPPRWALAHSKPVTVDKDGTAKVSTDGVVVGIYRVRFVDRQGRTVASPFAEIQPRRP